MLLHEMKPQCPKCHAMFCGDGETAIHREFVMLKHLAGYTVSIPGTGEFAGGSGVKCFPEQLQVICPSCGYSRIVDCYEEGE